MENAGTPPLAETDGTETGLDEAAQGGMLLPAQLCFRCAFCATVRRLRRYLQNAADLQRRHRLLADGASGPGRAGG